MGRGTWALKGGWCLSHGFWADVGTSHPTFLASVLTTIGSLWLESEDVGEPPLPSKDSVGQAWWNWVWSAGPSWFVGRTWFPRSESRQPPAARPGARAPSLTASPLVLAGLPWAVPQHGPHAAVRPGALARHAVAACQWWGRDQRAAGWTRFCPQMLGLQPRSQCEENPVHHALGRVHRPQVSQICPSLTVWDVGLKVLYLWLY